MNFEPGTVVVVTGASAGVGRAIAREFGRMGARVAVLARDQVRLQTVCDELAQMGSQGLPIVVDVADAEALEAAAERIERELGPIGIWVNNAMATLVSPVEDTEPEDFRRVTEVTYHGTVWGSMAALKRMRARDRGVIVQVGSALAYRSIPLQAAYCGAKHAARGFTEALRTELLHQGSRVRLCMVQLPAVNTPQFEWCQTSMPKRPQPVGKIYQPEVMARAIVWAALSGRREVYPTFSAAKAIWGDKVAPGLLDHYLADAAWDGQQSERPVNAAVSNLWQPVPGDYAARGRFSDRAKDGSLSLWANQHRNWLGAAALGVLALWRLGARR